MKKKQKASIKFLIRSLNKNSLFFLFLRYLYHTVQYGPEYTLSVYTRVKVLTEILRRRNEKYKN